MKRVALITCFTALAIAQRNSSTPRGEISVKAVTQEKNGAVRHLAGNVIFETDAIVLRADDVIYNEDSQELQARGDARVKLK